MGSLRFVFFWLKNILLLGACNIPAAFVFVVFGAKITENNL